MFLMFLCQNGRILVKIRSDERLPRSLIHSSTRQLIHSLPCYLVRLSARQFAKLCQLFSNNFNTKSALFIHHVLTLSQKIDSRRGLFWCKKCLVCEYDKMNIYFKKPPFVPHFGLFAAKYSAICGKTQCNMPQNAVRFGAKRKVKWC